MRILKSNWRMVFADDLAAHGKQRWSPSMYLTSPEIAFQRQLRKSEASSADRGFRKIRAIIRRALLARMSNRLGLTVPLGVFGPGLAIAHHGLLVVNSEARVGRNCRIHAGVTIGASRDGFPVIGDDVYIGPGSVISGALIIGDGAAIGANSVVLRDVPAGVTVAGAPAQIISTEGAATIHPFFNLFH